MSTPETASSYNTGSAGATPGRPTAVNSTVADLNKLYEQAKTHRTKFEPTWFLNLAFYQGDQHVFWNRTRLDRPRLDPWRIMLVDNRILGIVRTEVSKLTKSRPVFVATPRTSEEEDINAARVGSQLIEFLWRHLNLQRKLFRGLEWSRITGAGFWKIMWDKELGAGCEVLCDSQTGTPFQRADKFPPEVVEQMMGQPHPMGNGPMFTKKNINQGDIAVEVRSPFELYPDPLAPDLEDAEFIIEETVKSKEYLRARYGSKAEGLREDTDAMPGLVEGRMLPTFQATQGGTYKGVKVREFWSRPCSKYPKGKRAVWAQSQMLAEDNAPLDHCPYVMFPGIGVPGRFWPTSIVEHLRGPQTELNKLKSQIAENRNRIGNPALLVARQARVQYSGVPGERVEFDDTVQNAIPSYLQPPEMPSYVREERTEIQSAMQEISGQHEVTSAQVPPGVTAASAITVLLEQDDTRLGPSVADLEDALSRAGTKILTLAAKYYDDTRTIRIAGENESWTIKDFKGSMLRGTNHVMIQEGSAFPRSKAAKQAAMQEVLTLFVQNGMPLGKVQLAKYLRDMEVGGLERLIEQFHADESQVNRENNLLTQGVPLEINSFDNHEAHIDGHQEHMKTSTYAQLPPQIMANFEQHVALHREHVMEAMAPQMGMAPGGPGGPPGGAPGPGGPPQGPAGPPGPQGPPQ